MSTLRASRFNIIVALKRGRVLAYNSASAAFGVLEASEYQLLAGATSDAPVTSGQETAGLAYGGFLCDRESDELETIEADYKAKRFDSREMTLTIAPTLECNFGCDYCFQGRDKPTGKMGPDVQQALVGFVQRAAASIKRLHVAWYGGEPLLALPAVEYLSDQLIDLCSRASINYDAMIVTNGYKLTSEVAESLWRRRVRIAQVTLDGAEGFHDERRKLLGGQATYRRIIENVRRVVDDSQLRVACRINIDSRNSEHVDALLDDLCRAGLAGRKNFNVYFAPVEAITEGCHSIADACMTKEGYGELETTLQRRAFELRLSSLAYPGRYRGVCGAVRPRGFVVVPSGDVHKCWDTVSMPHMRVGTIFHPEALESSPQANEWLQWTPFENPICKSCKLLPSCAGACAHKFLNPDQTLGDAAALPCPSWKYQIKERLILFAEKSGAITKDDYDTDALKTDPLEICPAAPSAHALGRRARHLPILGAA